MVDVSDFDCDIEGVIVMVGEREVVIVGETDRVPLCDALPVTEVVREILMELVFVCEVVDVGVTEAEAFSFPTLKSTPHACQEQRRCRAIKVKLKLSHLTEKA